MLIPAWHVALVFLLAFIAKIAGRQYEHAVTRFMVFGLYVYFSLNNDLPDVQRQLLARWFLVLIGGIEFVSYVALRVVKRGIS